MAFLEVATNTDESRILPELKNHLTQLLAKSLGKPVMYIAVNIKANEDVYFGGTDEPAAICTLISTGALGIEQNKSYSKDIMALLRTNLDISPDRVYIEFRDLNNANLGFSETTFHELPSSFFFPQQ